MTDHEDYVTVWTPNGYIAVKRSEAHSYDLPARTQLADAMDIAERCHDNDQRPVVLALSALTEAVLHLADVVARDRVF